MTPIFLLGTVLGALPASAQVVEIAPRAAIIGDAGAAAVRTIPAAMGSVSGLPVLAAPAALGSVSASVAAAPSIQAAAAQAASPASAAAPAAQAAAAPAAALAPAPAAAASIPAAPAPSGDALRAAAPVGLPASAVVRVPGTAAEIASAFGSFLKGFSAVHEPLAAALNVGKIFDGTSARPTVPQSGIDSLAAESARLDVLPRSTGLMPSTGLTLAKGRKAAPKAAAADDSAQGIPLDADATDPASVEKALRALVDSDPKTFGAPSSQLAKISVNILPSIQPGQGASIIAVFRQAISGADNDEANYMLALSGKSLTFHIKVFKDGKPVIMGVSGQLASGVSADVMKVAFSDDELTALAAKRALLPPDQTGPSDGQAKTKTKSAPKKLDVAAAQSGKSKKPAPKSKKKSSPKGKTTPRTGKSTPRGDSVDDEPAAAPKSAAAPKFLTRQLTDEIDGKWRAVNIYQAADPQGEPLIVIVDVKTGDAYALSAKDLHTGDEAHRRHAGSALRHNLISGTVQGRATLPAADGSDNGPIGAVALPLTNVYDENGKVVAVTDENGNFSIPDNGSPAPVKLTIKLAGPLVPFVRDENAQQNGPVEVTVMATPGEKMTITLNPASDNPELAANIVGYVGYLNHHIWVSNLPGMDARMNVPLAGGIVVNGHEEQGNAFYDPSNDSVNLMAAATITVHDSRGRPVKLKVENTAVWSIEDHEDTHRVVQTYSQIQLTPAQKESPVYRFVKWSMDTIMGSDVNESIADVVSDFMRGVPIIGAGFYEGAPPKGQPDYIRTAEDKTPYDPKNPDPHNGVLVQSMWQVRKAFIASLGQEAGTVFANAMIPLILIAQPLNPIDALFHMAIWDMREDGSSPFGDVIRKIAKDDHGIDVPQTPLPPVPVG